ncbi:uncharacterized protein LOC111385692 [Olea europaea var. sylvestris]|uniref:FLZ-type domain-containing protein n=2 Tax=Olea europaea subsp. europaea TaxID=158383 RepID=A0A8S0PSH1_OLEEU|nr:uncharacterized protein LOC111385692 [Olea europaea var. sylvestris]CAA2955679.1 Hypothetical predicted protein [Olea europaea subsp. europaea]
MDSAATTSSRRKPCLMDGDYGPDYVAEMVPGSSVNSHRQNYSLNSSVFYCNSMQRMRKLSATPRSVRGMFFIDGFEEHNPHFLDACFLCKQPLSSNKDIFMYRGNIPFCSIECRQEQIDLDEAKEKNLNLSVSMRALRKKEQSKSSSPNKSSPNCPFRTGTLAAA